MTNENNGNKITLYLNDNTIDALNRVIELKELYKYPKHQAYGMAIDSFVALAQIPLCMYVPPHCVLPSWMCNK